MPLYDVNFGAHDNTKTLVIRRKDNLLTTPFTMSWNTVIDRHCLNSSEFRDFWVIWDRGIVKHGRGTVIGDDLIGEWTDPNPFPVKSICVLNSYNSKGDWIIHATGLVVEFTFSSTDDGQQMTSGSTPDILDHAVYLDKYGIEGSTITSFTFQVKASRDETIYLSSSTTMDSIMPFYDFNFGAHTNTKTQLVRRKDNLLTTPFSTSWNAVIDRHRLKG
ncbi:uncharacterized protein LOC127714027 [Mytilus californianus]|uniref:uncharacterized protein LOC127714027 n=1 Tax=Mytilus californianus TaxID=6549 RepID=UPI00224724BF|nr:uncharacterized protein LOC127714027 [Mytilus californianus]